MSATATAILHLEDSDLDAELIRARLEAAGLAPSIVRATDRDEFLAALGPGSRYDLILADYSLPSFDGLSALEVARDRAPETPFLFVSGRLGEEVAIDTLKRGATDYVLKQRLERLVPAVRRALDEARERAERRRAEAALREVEARHRLIIDSLTDYAVVTTDTAGLIGGWSAGAERLFGLGEGTALGRPLASLFAEEDARAGVPERELEQARRGVQSHDERWFVRADGSRFWGSGVLVPLVDGPGRLLGFTKVVRDISERKRAEDALREADRRKDEFLAMLAHELRNPMAAIANAAALARQTGLDPDQHAQAIEIVAHQARHLARLVDDLLDVSRINHGKITLRSQPLDLADVIRRAAETARPLVDERRHRLTVSIGPGPLHLTGDPTRLEQILVNLLTNAAKYTEPGGLIALTACREGGRLVVRIKDDGIGMAPQTLAKVFDLFAQADDTLARTEGGLGIGLTVARKLAGLHGGTLTAASEGLGRGSELTLTLPAADSPASAPRPDPTGAEPRPPAGSRVLIVDDNAPTAWTLAQILRASGHTVSTAHDGGGAVEAARRESPQVVLLDIGLPVMDGFQVARALRNESSMKDALLIAVTGYGGEHVLQRTREAGFDLHLIKPVDIDRLCSLLAEPERPARDAGGKDRVPEPA